MRGLSKRLKVVLTAFAVLLPMAAFAEGMFNFGRSLAELSAPDREAMKRARVAVLEKMQPGSVSAWSDSNTGHSGEVQLHRIYEKSGMTCGDVTYVLKVPQTKRFQTSFCRGSDGAWYLGG